MPHYIPMTRGILSTCYAELRDGRVAGQRDGIKRCTATSTATRRSCMYRTRRPSTKHVAGTNYCVVHPTIDLNTGQIIVASALDNLGKGAAARDGAVHEHHVRSA